ncbi:MAG: SIMPL domain-containing protein [Spirochaetales bacterium]|uniref:SIMPL domain-containing protein n=1 Tax=Candidatus Thalassospirochaeta sargassi TaxID=3119039 RepID=A0AAJ1MKR6_9SPIO|nr:SIMPL domain-containing protein [Spirochaetales bacterium]
MKEHSRTSAAIIGASIIIGLSALGLISGNAALKYKSFERTVTVKGLSEREYPADIVIWPVQFSEAGNDAAQLYVSIEEKSRMIKSFLIDKGLSADEISISPPSIVDKSAREYGDTSTALFRYTSTQTVTVYSDKIEVAREAMNSLSELGRRGIVFTGSSYQTEYIFNRLNMVKPEMIEEATANARMSAVKFAEDSNSKLGKIKTASQGQFSIYSRDKNNPHIKKVRVVSTVEYYLSD